MFTPTHFRGLSTPNVIEPASIDPDPQNWRVTEEMLMAQVRKVQSTKRVHSGRDDSKLSFSLN